MYKNHAKHLIEELKATGNYRNFVSINRVSGDYPLATFESSREGSGHASVEVWCSNDYLAMSQNPHVTDAMCEAARKYGVGAGGSRNIGGTNREIIALEREIAEWFGKERALVFPTGYSSNDATLEALSAIYPEAIIYSDSLNHASMIAGIRRHKGPRRVFRHNDTAHLEQLLRNDGPERQKIIVFESVYSMDGDVADIANIVRLASEHKALTYLDEVHAIGMYGDEGRGVAASHGLLDQIDLVQGTMAKSVGVIGGFIAGSDWLIDAVRSFAPGFIFTTALPPAVVAACRKSIDIIRKDSVQREKLHHNTSLLRTALQERDVPLMPSSRTHILPILVGDSASCVEAASLLLHEHGLYLQPICPPTVPLGTSRFRANATPAHTQDQIERFARSLDEVFTRLDIPRQAEGPMPPIPSETPVAQAAQDPAKL